MNSWGLSATLSVLGVALQPFPRSVNFPLKIPKGLYNQEGFRNRGPVSGRVCGHGDDRRGASQPISVLFCIQLVLGVNEKTHEAPPHHVWIARVPDSESCLKPLCGNTPHTP